MFFPPKFGIGSYTSVFFNMCQCSTWYIQIHRSSQRYLICRQIHKRPSPSLDASGAQASSADLLQQTCLLPYKSLLYFCAILSVLGIISHTEFATGNQLVANSVQLNVFYCFCAAPCSAGTVHERFFWRQILNAAALLSLDDVVGL